MTAQDGSEKVKNLLEYCQKTNVFVNPSITSACTSYGGLGVFGSKALPASTKLVQVPTDHIFNTNNIPQSFLSLSDRRHVPVHAQLAAFFAFGHRDTNGQRLLNELQPWLDTWPDFDGFVESLPMFWGSRLTDVLSHIEGDGRYSKPVHDRQLMNGSSPGLTDRDGVATKKRRLSCVKLLAKLDPLTLSPAFVDTSTSTSLLTAMSSKLADHISQIHKLFPNLDLSNNSINLCKFLHAWCSVNTRCFYYIPPDLIPGIPSNGHSTKTAKSRATRQKPKPPKDSNEAMGLCPFLDLFNHVAETTQNPSIQTDHNSPTICTVATHAKRGFTLTSPPRPVAASQELYISYGPHTNDTLWSEYGFILSSSSSINTNTHDSIPLLPLLPALQFELTKHEDLLSEHGYLPTSLSSTSTLSTGHNLNEIFTLFLDGSFSHATDLLAYLSVLATPEARTHYITTNDFPSNLTQTEKQKLQTRHDEILQSWLDTLNAICTTQINRLKYLLSISEEEEGEGKEEELLEIFGTTPLISQIAEKGWTRAQKLARARRRGGVCVRRWQQVREMCRLGMARSANNDNDNDNDNDDDDDGDDDGDDGDEGDGDSSGNG